MNIADFTLRIKYIIDGEEKEVSASGEFLQKGYKNQNVAVAFLYDNGRLKVDFTAVKPVKLTLVELLYSHKFETEELFFANGFQSWTKSREYSMYDTQKGLSNVCKLPYIKKFAGASGDYHFTNYGKLLYHSFTYTYLRKGGSLELIGSLDERNGYTVFYADMRENTLAIVKDIEGLKDVDKYTLFDVYYASGSYDTVFDAYFKAYPRKHTGRVDRFTGYTSWYNYYQNINRDIILRDLEGLKKAGDAANIFQIDDGFERKVGDWQLDEKKFPDGMLPIVEKIHAQGLKAGLWLAPFAAQFSAEIIKQHPEWLIRDEKGKPIVSGIAWGGFYAIDFELDEVKEHIRKLFDTVLNDWDFDMVKLDFLYAAAIYPRNGKTRGQLMCEAMDFLRECVGGKIILGCGVPLGPAFGVVDACRIGCDAEISFKDKFYVGITNQEIVSTRNSINNSVFRRHLNRIFANDPDVFFLRDGGYKKAKYNQRQKELLATINHIFGDVLFVSDNVGDYDDNALKMLLEAYKPFDGIVLGAEYADANTLIITYDEGGESHVLAFDTRTGKKN